MSDIVKSEKGGLMGLFHGQNGGLTIPKPYEREIFLFDSYIAGTNYIEGMNELEPHLKKGDKLDFFREPDNPYDKKAIVIKNADGVKIGYVSRSDNVIFARLMDAEKLIYGRIGYKEKGGNWLRICIKIYLYE